MTGTLHEDVFTFITVSFWILLRMRNFVDRSCRENQNTHFVFNNFYDNRASWDNVEECGWAIEATKHTIRRMRVACWVRKTIRAHAHIHAHTSGRAHTPTRRGKYVILIAFPWQLWFANATHSWVMRTLRVLWKYKIRTLSGFSGVSWHQLERSELRMNKWTESELLYSRILGEAESPSTWSHPDSLEAVTKGRNSGIEMSDHERSKLRTRGLTGPVSYCIGSVHERQSEQFGCFPPSCVTEATDLWQLRCSSCNDVSRYECCYLQQHVFLVIGCLSV